MTTETTKALPNNMEAEQGLLGMLLVDNKRVDMIADSILPAHFHYPVHAQIYEAILTLTSKGQSACVVALKEFFSDHADLARVGGVSYLVDLLNVPMVNHVRDYARIVLDCAMRRAMVVVAQDIAQEASSPDLGMTMGDILARAEAKLFQLTATGGAEKEVVSLGEGLRETLALVERAQLGKISGIPSGIETLDEKICGFERGELSIVAGRPSMGKTAVALTMALNAAQADYKVLFLSLEMQTAQLGLRLLARKTGIPAGMQRRPHSLNKDGFPKLTQAAGAMGALPMYIDETATMTAGQIATRARRHKRTKGGLDLVVIDYLGLIRPTDQRAQKVHQLEDITQRLKAMAKELDVHVMLLSQINRGVEGREDKRPSLADLRDSGAIEQDADVVLFPFRPEYYLKKEEPQRKAGESDEKFNVRYASWEQLVQECAGRAEIIIGKFRQGEQGSVRCKFDGPRQYFYADDHFNP